MSYEQLPTNQPKASVDQKTKYLDAIRGIAAFNVALHHANYAFGVFPTAGHWYHGLLDGSFQVSLFFVLSGHVLVLSYLKKPSTDKMVSNLVRRPFRMAFPMIAAILMSTIIHRAGFFQLFDDYVQNVPLEGWWASNFVYFKDAPIISQIGGIVRGLFWNGNPYYQAGVFWTLPLETEISYVVYSCAFVIAGLKRNRIAFLVLLNILLISTGRVTSLFISGLLLCYLQLKGYFAYFQHPASKRAKVIAFAAKAGVGILFLVLMTDNLTTYLNQLSMWFIVNHKEYQSVFILPQIFGAPLLILLIDMSPMLQTILEFRPLTFLGDISFGMYLTHGPMLPVVRLCLSFFQHRGFTREQASLPSLIIYVLVSIGTGYLFYEYLDKPLMTLLSQLYSLSFNPNATFWTVQDIPRLKTAFVVFLRSPKPPFFWFKIILGVASVLILLR
ncbi:acyltransferase 3 [Gorgonomyces haynaldii]|nr:acyltransferase 3 [Gorgonomyces haynaldii]KAI8905992.1 acyltransferase 3 [Gorgonomyces haynaldii]